MKIKFSGLKPGLQSTHVQLDSVEQAFGTAWETTTIHEVIYVNYSEKELVLKVFSQYTVLTEEQFNSRNYSKPKRA